MNGGFGEMNSGWWEWRERWEEWREYRELRTDGSRWKGSLDVPIEHRI